MLAVSGKDWVGVIKNSVRDEMNQNIHVIEMIDISKDEDYDVGKGMIELGLVFPALTGVFNIQRSIFTPLSAFASFLLLKPVHPGQPCTK